MWGNVKKRAKKRILRSNFIEQWKEKESNGERKKENEEKKRKKKKKTEVDLVASFRVLKNFPRLGRNSISLMHRALQNTAFISSFR